MLVVAPELLLLLAITFWYQPNGASCASSMTLMQSPTSASFAQTITTAPVETAPAELRRRQQSALATCGFIAGDANRAVTCPGGHYCAVTSTFVGCCTLNDCRDIYTTCYDRLGAVCDQSCQQNPQNLICPSSVPYCARFNYENGSVGIGCATFSGLTSTVLLTVASALATLTTPSVLSADSASRVAASSTGAAVTQSSGSSGLSGGSIAGIVVGVVIGVALSSLAAWFAFRKMRKTKNQVENEPEVADIPGPMRDSSMTELDNNSSTHRSWAQSSSDPDRSGRTSYLVQQTYVPVHHGREFSFTPEELPDNSRPLMGHSTDATANTSRS